jgi:hypothetical protein
VALRKGLAVSVLWADVAERARKEAEEWARRAPIGPLDGRDGVLAVARYVAVTGSPFLVELWELEDEGAGHGGTAERLHGETRDALETVGATATRNVYVQIFPPAVDERAAVHPPAPALQVGRIGIPTEHDEEFNEWYNGEYLVGYLKVPGVYGARRYRNRGPGLPYLTLYELANDEVSRQPEWDRARAASVWRRRIERLWTHADGSPGIYRRLSYQAVSAAASRVTPAGARRAARAPRR